MACTHHSTSCGIGPAGERNSQLPASAKGEREKMTLHPGFRLFRELPWKWFLPCSTPGANGKWHQWGGGGGLRTQAVPLPSPGSVR